MTIAAGVVARVAQVVDERAMHLVLAGDAAALRHQLIVSGFSFEAI